MGSNSAAPAIDAVVLAIKAGDYELTDLTRLERVIKHAKTREVKGTFARGQTVRFLATTRPKYLVGAKGLVTRVNASRVWVQTDPDPALGRFSGIEVSVPAALLEVCDG